jgi:hypothetical protein
VLGAWSEELVNTDSVAMGGRSRIECNRTFDSSRGLMGVRRDGWSVRDSE